jgi:hypothetical protein
MVTHSCRFGVDSSTGPGAGRPRFFGAALGWSRWTTVWTLFIRVAYGAIVGGFAA